MLEACKRTITTTTNGEAHARTLVNVSEEKGGGEDEANIRILTAAKS